MSPFKVLYGIQCKVPLIWGNLEERMVLGPYMLSQMETMVRQIKKNVKATHDIQKHYADKKRTTKEYNVGEHVFLRIKT